MIAAVIYKQPSTNKPTCVFIAKCVKITALENNTLTIQKQIRDSHYLRYNDRQPVLIIIKPSKIINEWECEEIPRLTHGKISKKKLSTHFKQEMLLENKI